MDLISDALGFRRAGPASFPRKLDYCIKCGVVGDRILKKLNKIRNAIEHDYYVPNQGEAEDYVDIVELFIKATDPLMYSFPTEVSFESEHIILDVFATSSIALRMKPFSGVIEIDARKLNNSLKDIREKYVEKYQPHYEQIKNSLLLIKEKVETSNLSERMKILSTEEGFSLLEELSKLENKSEILGNLLSKYSAVTKDFKDVIAELEQLVDSYFEDELSIEVDHEKLDSESIDEMTRIAYELSDKHHEVISAADNESYFEWVKLMINSRF